MADLFPAAGEQLIVDLPGVTDVKQAIDMIGQTPLLEFKTEAPEGTPQNATVDKNGKVTWRHKFSICFHRTYRTIFTESDFGI